MKWDQDVFRDWIGLVKWNLLTKPVRNMPDLKNQVNDNMKGGGRGTLWTLQNHTPSPAYNDGIHIYIYIYI